MAIMDNEVVGSDELSKSFGSTRALNKVSFSIQGPQVVGILGPNGAGKTTLLEILEGLSRPDEGKVRLFGAPLDIARYPKSRVGVVIQKESVLEKINVAEYADLFASIYGVVGGREAIIEMAGLAGRKQVPVENLSGGEAQRLFIAAAAVNNPELLFLDEPTAQLDPENKRRIGDWLRQMASRRTIILTTHDLREADSVCNHIIFLVNGELKAQGSPAELVDSVPDFARSGAKCGARNVASDGLGLEDAFFYYCASRLTPTGELE